MGIDDAVQNGRWLWLRRSELQLMIRALETREVVLDCGTIEEGLREALLTTLKSEVEKLR